MKTIKILENLLKKASPPIQWLIFFLIEGIFGVIMVGIGYLAAATSLASVSSNMTFFIPI